MAERADTADQFLSLLVECSPYEHAGRRFNLSIKEIAHLMDDIEDELNEKVEIRYTRSKWIDYTDHFQQTDVEEGDKQVFLFIN